MNTESVGRVGGKSPVPLEQFKNDERYSALLELYKEKCEELRLLRDEHTRLRDEHTQLRDEHTKLKFDYSENTIVQSMNAMKEQYEELVASTVAKFRYDILNERLHNINRVITTSSVILGHATREIQNIIERFLYGGQNKLDLQKIGFELAILSEILMEQEISTEI